MLSVSDPSHRISTLHASFPDYMFNPARSKEFSCNIEAHSGKLAELCFRRISRNNPQFNICRLESSYAFDEDAPLLDEKLEQHLPVELLYASLYWATHLSLGERLHERVSALHEFLSKRLLLWMEVLNLSKRISRAVGQIETAISWLEATESSEDALSLARDALRFVTMFATSSVSRSTPHLYTSMLSSWPKYQPVSMCYSNRTTDLVKIKGIENSERQLSLLSLIPGPAGSYIRCVACSPDGTFIAAGTADDEVLIWDAATCRMTIDPIEAHIDKVRAIAISPDSSRICSGSDDQTLRIWDPQSGRLIAGPLKGHTNWVRSVAYSPNGFWLASASNDGTVRIWNTRDWGMRGDPLDGDDGRVLSVVFSPDSSVIAAGYESLIHLWDVASGQTTGEPLKGHTNFVCTLAFTPSGKHLISGSWDRTIRIWDVSTGQLAFGPLQEHLSAVECVTVSPNGKLLVSAATDDTIRTYDTKSWTTRSVFRHTGVAKGVAFSPDGSRLISGSVDGNIRVWEVPDTSTKKTEATRLNAHSGAIRSTAFSPCGTYIVSGSEDLTVRMWDAKSGQQVGNSLVGHNDWVTWVGISADGHHIFSVSEDQIVHVWDNETGQLEYTIGPIGADGIDDPSYQERWPAAFLFEGRRTVCGSKSGRIYMWENDKLVNELTGHNHSVYSISFAPNGKSFVSGDDEGNLILWDTSSGVKLIGPFNPSSSRINSIAFSPDGLLVAIGMDNRTIRLCNIHTGSLAGNPLKGHTSYVRSVAFSPQGTHLVSGSDDMTIRVWDVASGQSITVLEGHTDWIFAVAFSPDGARIVSGSADMTIRIWNVPMPAEHLSGNSQNEHTVEPADTPQDNRALSWTMDKNGWIQDDKGRLLLWVPPDLRSTLLRSQNTVLISRQGCIEIDLSIARIGDKWETCYQPFPPDTRS